MAPPLLDGYRPKGVDRFVEESNLNGLVIAAIGYGILFTIFVQCVILIRKAGSKSKVASWSLCVSILLFVLATMGFAGNTAFVQLTYVDFRDFPGGPNAFTQVFYAHPTNYTGFISYVIMSWLADGIMLYRFMMIYNFKVYLMLFPVSIYLGILATSIGLIIAIRSLEQGFWAAQAMNFGIAYWSLSLSLNIIITVAIAGRLFYMRSKLRNAFGDQPLASPYISVAAMIIESASLYTSTALIFIVLYARHSPVQNYVLPVLGQVQGIAPLLIIFRVSQGKAWDRGTADTTMGTVSNIRIRRGKNSQNTSSIPLGSMSTAVTVQVEKSTGSLSEQDHMSRWKGQAV